MSSPIPGNRPEGRIARPGLSLLVAGLASGLLTAGCANLDAGGDGDSPVSLGTVPTPHAYVSGGNTLLRLDPTESVDPLRLSLRVNGNVVPGPLRPAPSDPLGREDDALLVSVDGLADYDVEFTDDEWSRLQSIFPDGVCDWSRPGVGMEVEQRTWLSFGPSPVNRWEPER